MYIVFNYFLIRYLRYPLLMPMPAFSPMVQSFNIAVVTFKNLMSSTACHLFLFDFTLLQ